MQTITPIEAFIYGMAGAFFTYLVIFRANRLRSILANFDENWKVLVFDIFIYTLAGGFVSAFITTSATVKEAVLTGVAWNAVIAGWIHGEIRNVLVNFAGSEESQGETTQKEYSKTE